MRIPVIVQIDFRAGFGGFEQVEGVTGLTFRDNRIFIETGDTEKMVYTDAIWCINFLAEQVYYGHKLQ